MNEQKFSEINDFIKKDARRLLIEMGRLEGTISALESFLKYDDQKKAQNEWLFERLNAFLTSFL